MIEWTHIAADGLAVVIMAAKTLVDRRIGKQRDGDTREFRDSVAGLFASLKLDLEKRFNVLQADITEVRHVCVGIDGENGMRGDLRHTEQEVRDLHQLVDRMLDRLRLGEPLRPGDVGRLER